MLIQDAVRPFIDAALIDRCLRRAGEHEGALARLPVADTLKRLGSTATSSETVDRDGLFCRPDASGFPFRPILAAHEAAAVGRADFTDDAAIAEWAGLPVTLVAGTPDNIKSPARDIAMAEQKLGGGSRLPDVAPAPATTCTTFVPG